jgi:hypothetical protein
LGDVLRASRRKDHLDRAESVDALHRVVAFFHRANIGHSGAGVERSGKVGELFGRTDGINFHTAVVKIACPARNAKFGGALLNEVAKSDSLHTT